MKTIGKLRLLKILIVIGFALMLFSGCDEIEFSGKGSAVINLFFEEDYEDLSVVCDKGQIEKQGKNYQITISNLSITEVAIFKEGYIPQTITFFTAELKQGEVSRIITLEKEVNKVKLSLKGVSKDNLNKVTFKSNVVGGIIDDVILEKSNFYLNISQIPQTITIEAEGYFSREFTVNEEDFSNYLTVKEITLLSSAKSKILINFNFKNYNPNNYNINMQVIDYKTGEEIYNQYYYNQTSTTYEAPIDCDLKVIFPQEIGFNFSKDYLNSLFENGDVYLEQDVDFAFLEEHFYYNNDLINIDLPNGYILEAFNLDNNMMNVYNNDNEESELVLDTFAGNKFIFKVKDNRSQTVSIYIHEVTEEEITNDLISVVLNKVESLDASITILRDDGKENFDDVEVWFLGENIIDSAFNDFINRNLTIEGNCISFDLFVFLFYYNFWDNFQFNTLDENYDFYNNYINFEYIAYENDYQIKLEKKEKYIVSFVDEDGEKIPTLAFDISDDYSIAGDTLVFNLIESTANNYVYFSYNGYFSRNFTFDKHMFHYDELKDAYIYEFQLSKIYSFKFIPRYNGSIITNNCFFQLGKHYYYAEPYYDNNMTYLYHNFELSADILNHQLTIYNSDYNYVIKHTITLEQTNVDETYDLEFSEIKAIMN